MNTALRTLVRPVRSLWRRLTSMRTALILLFLLAVAAVPGSILPQRPLNSSKAESYISEHGGWGQLLDKVGMFDVFGSVWFSAIYLLLFVSLIGCLVPRIRLHARSVIRKPLPAPRNLDRLPESATFAADGTPEQIAATVRSSLGRRWRTVVRDEGGAVAVSAEKGYSRETGNLLFHIALLVSLVLIAVGRLYNYEGERIVLQGESQGFCNIVAQYDTWRPGRFAAEGTVQPAPFCIDELTQFTATYTDGAPSEFAADIVYRNSLDAEPQQARITVNHPLRLEGDRVYLVSHGFAPQITVRMPDGTVRHDVQAFLPTNATTFYSEGAYKLQGAADANQDVGIQGFFAPTPYDPGNGVVESVSPEANDPVLGVVVWDGDLNYTGVAQSVYSLDTTKMSQLGKANLQVGRTKQFSNGVSVTFDGWVPWASLQVSHDPAQGWLLAAAVAMVAGLLASLGIRRRRVWVRMTPTADSHGDSLTVVSVGGLARSDSGNFSGEFEALLERLAEATSADRQRTKEDAWAG